MGKMFFNILATFAEFEADLIRLRTREGMKIAPAKGRLRGKQPKLSDKQQKELGPHAWKWPVHDQRPGRVVLHLSSNCLPHTAA